MMKPVLKKCILLTASLWVGCCALLAAFYFLMMAPQQKAAAEIKIRIADKQQLAQYLRRAATPQAQDKLKSELIARQDHLHEYLINLDDVSKLTFHAGEIARQNPDIEAGSFASKHLTSGPGAEIENCPLIMEQRFNVKFKSNFQGFARFVNTMERNQPVVFVDKFKIERDKSSEAEIIDMDLTVFVKSPPGRENVGAEK